MSKVIELYLSLTRDATRLYCTIFDMDVTRLAPAEVLGTSGEANPREHQDSRPCPTKQLPSQ